MASAAYVLTPTVSTWAGSGTAGTADDTDPLKAEFYAPNGIAFDSSGYLYVADMSNNAIRKITPAGVVTTFAGAATGASGAVDGSGTDARFREPMHIAIDPSGNFLVTESMGCKGRRISPAGEVETITGSGDYDYLDGLGTEAKFKMAAGIAIDADGVVYMADRANNRIRKLTE